MDLHTIIAAHGGTPGAPLPLAALILARDLLAAGERDGWAVATPEDHLAAVAAQESIRALNGPALIKAIAAADRVDAARAAGMTMVDTVAIARRIPKREATNVVLSANDDAEFPDVLAAAADARMSRANMHETLRTLRCIRAFVPDDDFATVRARLIAAAAEPLPALFRATCRKLREDVNENAKRDRQRWAAEQVAQSRADRGFTFRDRHDDPAFGVDVRGHLTAEDWQRLGPIWRKAAAQVRRRRQQSGAPPMPERERFAEALHDCLSSPALPARPASAPVSPVQDRALEQPARAPAVREGRLASPRLREALRHRDGGCVFPYCTAEFEHCELHHIVPFRDGGRTEAQNLAALCPQHHALVQHPPGDAEHWTIRMADDGLPDAIPPRSIDSEQRPVRHGRLNDPPHLLAPAHAP